MELWDPFSTHCWTFSRCQCHNPSITLQFSVLSHLLFSLGVLISHFKHNLANSPNNLSFNLLHAVSKTLNSGSISHPPSVHRPWLLHPAGGKRENHVMIGFGDYKIMVCQLGWALDAALKISHLYHSFLLFSATAISNLSHFPQACNLIPLALLSVDNQKRTPIHLYLPLSFLTKTRVTHVWSLPSPTWVEGVSFHLCSGSLLRLLLYKCFPLSPKSSSYFFLLILSHQHSNICKSSWFQLHVISNRFFLLPTVPKETLKEM